MHPATYTQTQRGVIDGLIAGPMYTGERGAVPQLILSSADNGTVIAWSLWERLVACETGATSKTWHPRSILHYIWVAQPLRKSGFASRILREHGADRSTVVSHWSDAAQRCFDGSQEIRQLFSATNSHHPRYSPTLATNPNAFVAM